MMEWLITGLLLLAIAVLAAVIWQAQKAVADMRASVKETVEEALGKAALGFENASYKALGEQQEKASETLSKSLTPVQKELAEARKQLEDYSRKAAVDATASQGNHDEVVRLINNLNKEATNLSNALRGDVKKMGDWGEHALDKILEVAGLEEGRDYERQASVATEEGKLLRPDILLKLPKDGDGKEKAIAVDAKVSLTGYTEYSNAGDDEQVRKAGLEKFVAAVKKQAEQTAKYRKLEDFETPGFVLMFMPITPAWELLQRQQNGQLVADIQRRQGVVILGPTNLMVAMKMVAHLWRGYKQAANVEEFVVTAGKLIDAFDLTSDRLANLKRSFDTSQAELEKMEKSLQGKQGLVVYANKLKELGVKGKKEDG